MRVTVDIQQLAILALLVAAFILVIFLIRLAAKASRTLDRVNKVLEDSQRVTAIAAERSEQVNGVMDDAVDTASNLLATLRGNASLMEMAGTCSAALAAIRGYAVKLRNRDALDEAVRKRRIERARRARKHGAR